jgi:YHS domain-containing protein
MKRLLLPFLLTVAGVCLVVGYTAYFFEREGAFADSPYFVTANGALDGADPVAYFTLRKMVRGKESIVAEWQGVTWRFVNEEHRDMFMREPENFAPQYGGYCAFGMAEGMTFDSVPEAWSIVDNKLYLNYDLQTRNMWESNKSTVILEADRYWPDVLDSTMGRYRSRLSQDKSQLTLEM